VSLAHPQLVDVLRPVKHVLLDFDGPLCSIFSNLPAHEVARRLRRALNVDGEVPPEWVAEADPLALLRRIDDERPELVVRADQALTRLESEAAMVALPTPGAESFLMACANSGRFVWIVSNNSGEAIRSYVEAHDLGDLVAGVFGRIPGEPSAMKPDPRLLSDAMDVAGARQAECVFVGDAVRDVEAGDAAGVSTIGYANKPGKDAALRQAGAIAVVDSMQTLADSLA
jgi:N-acetyl-D-muramate 6-phosphate phosphatase